MCIHILGVYCAHFSTWKNAASAAGKDYLYHHMNRSRLTLTFILMLCILL